MSFTSRLKEVIGGAGRLCVGLDPDFSRLPAELQAQPPLQAILQFNARMIAATAPYAAAYKLNAAFYEVLGSAGLTAMQETIRAIPPGRMVIVDAKRGDIANTAAAYAAALFDQLPCDATTVSPYMGGDSLEPFFSYGAQSKGSFVLCRTSNAGGNDLQSLLVEGPGGGLPLYLRVVQLVLRWDAGREAAGLVVGATYPAQLAAVREIAAHIPILIPGVGTQGGDLAATIKANGSGPALINISRAILYAAEGSLSEMEVAAAAVARSYQQQMG